MYQSDIDLAFQGEFYFYLLEMLRDKQGHYLNSEDNEVQKIEIISDIIDTPQRLFLLNISFHHHSLVCFLDYYIGLRTPLLAYLQVILKDPV